MEGQPVEMVVVHTCRTLQEQDQIDLCRGRCIEEYLHGFRKYYFNIDCPCRLELCKDCGDAEPQYMLDDRGHRCYECDMIMFVAQTEISKRRYALSTGFIQINKLYC